MKITLLILIVFFTLKNINGQSKPIQKYYNSPAYIQTEAESLAKKYLIKEVLNSSNETTSFEIDYISSAISGEVSTLAYNCREQKKGGVIFTFFGGFGNEYGTYYTGYAFRNLDKDSTLKLLNRLKNEITFVSEIQNKDFNIYFSFSDMTFLLNKFTSSEFGSVRIKMFWREFEADWTRLAIEKSHKRIENWFFNKN
jgi:hypothetical protein